MRFIRALVDQRVRVGVVQGDDTVALSPAVPSLDAYLGDADALREMGEAVLTDPYAESPLGELSLLTPVRPTSMRDFMAFEEHILPMRRVRGYDRAPDVWYERPIGYFSNAAVIQGPHDAIEIPGGCERLDFELEIGAIVSRDCSSVRPAEAADHIAGYLVLCDWSARDIQMREMEGMLGPFKGKDFASSLGTMLVTPDHIESYRQGNGYSLRMRSEVNGQQYGEDVWASTSWSFEELLSYASWNSTVERGALVGTGTCQGGCISELSTRNPGQYPWLRSGDEVTLKVEALGEIRATILPPSRAAWPGFRPVDTTATVTV